jgi:hypothetical protein
MKLDLTEWWCLYDVMIVFLIGMFLVIVASAVHYHKDIKEWLKGTFRKRKCTFYKLTRESKYSRGVRAHKPASLKKMGKRMSERPSKQSRWSRAASRQHMEKWRNTGRRKQ